jgi:hypothetical protein
MLMRWSSRLLVCLVLTVMVGSLTCKKQKLVSPTHPPVTYNKNDRTVFIPNATIITGGTEYSESAPLPDTGLALVITEDSSLYFYSARLGDLDSIVLEHSCKAIGYFLLANLGEPGPSPADLNVELESGIYLRTVPDGKVECTNVLHRWAVAKVSPSGERVLLTPRRFFKLNLISIFSDWGDVFQINRVALDTVVSGESYETYGGIAKAFLCTASVPFMTRGLAIQQGFNSDPTVFSCLQVLDGLDIIWLVVEAVSPAGGEQLGEVIARLTFKTAIKTAAEGTLGEIVAAGSSEKIFKDAQRKLLNTFLDELIKAILSPQTTNRDSLRAVTVASDGTQLVEPVMILTILKAMQILVSAVDVGWGVYDEASHDAYAAYIDSTRATTRPIRLRSRAALTADGLTSATASLRQPPTPTATQCTSVSPGVTAIRLTGRQSAAPRPGAVSSQPMPICSHRMRSGRSLCRASSSRT